MSKTVCRLCDSYMCPQCGPRRRDLWGNWILQQFRLEVAKGGAIYHARCRVADYDGRLRYRLYRAGAGFYTVTRESEGTKYVFGNRDFTAQRWAKLPPIRARRLAPSQFKKVLSRALRLPERLRVNCGGNWHRPLKFD